MAQNVEMNSYFEKADMHSLFSLDRKECKLLSKYDSFQYYHFSQNSVLQSPDTCCHSQQIRHRGVTVGKEVVFPGTVGQLADAMVQLVAHPVGQLFAQLAKIVSVAVLVQHGSVLHGCVMVLM